MIGAVVAMIASAIAPGMCWDYDVPDVEHHARPNTGRWIGALWCDGRLISADRFTSRSRARHWANRSRVDYGSGIAKVVPYRARQWRRMDPLATEEARLRNMSEALTRIQERL